MLQDWIDEFFDSLPEDFDADEEAQYAVDDCGPNDEEDDPSERVSPSVATALTEYLSSVDERERLEAMHDVLSVVNAWEDLYIDHEKVVGHLLLQHRANPADLIELSHDAALARHASLHEQSGATHSAVD